jgi:hypothetical protein
MSLLTYQEAKPFARAMKQRTALARSKYGRNAMPPWYIEKNIGIQAFKDDVSLSDAEIALIGAWADSGAPEGNPADLKPAPAINSTAWVLGKPDLIAATPTITMPGVGPDQWLDLDFPPSPLPGISEDRFVSAAEYKEVPVGARKKEAGGTVGNLYIIHHANGAITDGPPENSAGTFTLTTHEVGRNATTYPQDAGVPLKVGSAIQWSNQFHLHSPGVPGERSSVLQVGLKLHPLGYKPKYRMASISAFGNTEIEVAPGDANGRSEAYFVVPQPMKLVNYEPHMHAAGVRKCLEAIYQRSIETLNCAGYDHNWVRSYQYDDNYAPLLPKGTILKMTGWLDNSAKNANIIEPRNQGNWGRRSVVNMLILFSNAIMLTDEQYEQELATRRAFLDKTDSWDSVIGCPGCWEIPPANANAKRDDKDAPAAKTATKGQKGPITLSESDENSNTRFAAPSVD